MDEVKQYKTASAFRTALETRLQARAQVERTDLQRLRRQVAFELFGEIVSEGAEGNVSVDPEGRLCDGAADSLRANHERYRFDLA